MAVEHTFLGTWEIASCKFEDKPEISGLEGIKFRLDDTGDITWYNDLVSPIPESKGCGTCCDSTSVLFTCETFDVNITNPHLIFGAFAGHSIEFMTNTLRPNETLVLKCENWYTLQCNRLKEDQAAGQEKVFSFLKSLQEPYFSDVIIKSSDNIKYKVHSSILRLNGFDCSMLTRPTGNSDNSGILTRSINCLQPQTKQQNQPILKQQLQKSADSNFKPIPSKAIQISVTLSAKTGILKADSQKSLPCLNISPIFLQPPIDYAGNREFAKINSISGNLITQRNNHLSNSFSCFSIDDTSHNGNTSRTGSINCVGNTALNVINSMRRFPPTSQSDSHLESQSIHCRNIFNFCQDFVLQSSEPNTMCNARRPPLSPYRARSPSPFPSAMDTPPSSPLTPVSVLYNLPTFILTPVLHWLYTESLLPNMEERICEKLINFAELQPSLTKMVEPIKKYLKLLRLKNFVINIVMDLHRILDRIIQSINPMIISQGPSAMYLNFKDCLKESAIGCAKVLQFCNIFIKDASDITRYQKNEIIKYIRTRIPIFLSQLHQLLRNILNVFTNFTEVDKTDLVNYLVPEIESTLSILTTVIEEIKKSLEKMCKDIKCSHLELSRKQKVNTDAVKQTQTNRFIPTVLNTIDDIEPQVHTKSPQLPQPRHIPLSDVMLYDNTTDRKCLMAGENDLKFVLYMYEVRKMRDIYGRVSAALDIIRDKKATFCEMDFYSKCSTIHQNLEQMVLDIPAYILLLENLSDRLDEKLGWKEFKFCFKLATSQINGVIVTLFDHKCALMDSINEVCKLVQKPEFTQSLIELGLLEHLNILHNEMKLPDNENNMSLNDCTSCIVNQIIDYKNVKLNLVKHLCESPAAVNSTLSKNALRVLHSAQLADMEFEVHTYATCGCNLHNSGQEYVTTTLSTSNKTEKRIQSNAEYKQEQCSPIQVHSFKAHRVIVSARCEWFKKALLSGMQESITRKIIITDTTPVIFRRLLLYLYGAPIDKTVGAEQICELMLLADRFSIEDLKELCETTLNTLIDEESVLCLLSIADHYMATALKSNCLSFMSQHATLTKTPMFQDLPQSLQLEVTDIIRWCGRISEPWNDEFKSNIGTRYSLKSPMNSRSRSRKSSPSYI